jgi:hypothetical protein
MRFLKPKIGLIILMFCTFKYNKGINGEGSVFLVKPHSLYVDSAFDSFVEIK